MLIHELTLRGILSFSPDSSPLEMRPLNVLIGPNGAGKSNIVEAIDLLRSASTHLAAPIRAKAGGGIREWIWKGANNGHAQIEAVVDYPEGAQSLCHRIEFIETGARFELTDEVIEGHRTESGNGQPSCFYRFQNGHAAITSRLGGTKQLQHGELAVDESILSQRKDPDQYPELAYLARVYNDVRLYREWSFGRASVFRAPQPADTPNDRLEEDLSNLGLFLNYLRSAPKAREVITERLNDLYAGVDDFDVRIKGGTVEVFVTEGDFIIPASRLSDGTLRYLALLAILCDPDPPPLICIEEPELGLHPDVLPKIADLLVEASRSTQLIVTTHSDVLVDAMTEHPEAVVVIEKHDGKTTAQRLEATNEMRQWLDRYRLGQLWLRGEIGGTRW